MERENREARKSEEPNLWLDLEHKKEEKAKQPH